MESCEGLYSQQKMGLESICQGCRSGECEQKEYDTHSSNYGNSSNNNYDLDDEEKKKKYH